MSEQTTPTPPAAQPATPPANAAPANGAATPPAAEAPAGPSKADLAKEKMKAGLAVFSKMGAGAAGKFKNALKSFVMFPLLIFRGDWSTRFLTLAFLTSLILLAVTGSQITGYLKARFVKPEAASPPSKSKVSDFLTQQKELQIAQANVLFLERFSTSIKAKQGNLKSYEVELYVNTDDPETAKFLRGRLEATREVVIAALQDQVYENLLTDQGKEALKLRITEHLNKALKKWRGSGQIKAVFFTRFIMG